MEPYSQCCGGRAVHSEVCPELPLASLLDAAVQETGLWIIVSVIRVASGTSQAAGGQLNLGKGIFQTASAVFRQMLVPDIRTNVPSVISGGTIWSGKPLPPEPELDGSTFASPGSRPQTALSFIQCFV